MSRHVRCILFAAAAAAVWLASAPAQAFEIQTSFSSSCHERITLDAIDAAGWPGGEEPPEPDENMRRVIDDLTFDLPGDKEDPWTVALLIGVRSNDVGSNDPFDVAALSELHNDPARQPEHCLRRRGDDNEQGDVTALAACRDFVLAELELALGQGDDLDVNETISIETFLAFRGEIDIDVPRFAYHVGRAAHALEDSFTHAFRNPGDQRVRSVLNWIDGNVGSDHVLARDGHPHVQALDECGGGGEKAERQAAATAAVTDLLMALVSPEGGRAGRLARAEAAFEEHTVREEGCVEANEWCGTGFMEPWQPACSAGASSVGSFWLALLVGIAFLARRGRGGAALLALVVASGTASAEPRRTAQTVEERQEEEDEPDRRTEQRLDREERVIDDLPDPITRPWGAAFSLGASVDRAAGAVAAGVRWNPSDMIGLGLDVEYNPWVSFSAGKVAAGAASAYVPLIVRLKRFGSWELRTTAYAGATMLLFDLVGADEGSIGVFAGLNPLGLAVPIGSDFKLVVKPGDIVVSAPQLRGIPFFYQQYRLTFGVEWYP